jgi:uncharacterized protein (TIGR02217 family)
LVKIAAQEGGFERVGRRWTRPLNLFTAVPMGDRDEVTIQRILYFWHAMHGRATTFLFKDWTDYKSCSVDTDITAVDQPLETFVLGDATTAYQLTKVYQVGPITQVREITQPKGDTIIIANATGDAQTDFTLDEATGVLKPGGSFSGTPHSWGGEFYVPVRFDSELDMQVVDKEIQTVGFTLREKRVTLATTFVGGGGITWTRGADAPEFMLAIAFGAGVIVGVGNDSGSVYASSDLGETWTEVVTADFPTVFGICVAYANGQFVVGGVGSVMISADGFTWGDPITVASAVDSFVVAVAGDGAGNLIALGGQTVGANYAVSSDNGATWSVPGGSSIGDWNSFGGAVYDAARSQFVALGFQDGTFALAMYTSLDGGSTWTEHLFTSGFDIFSALAYDGTHFLIGFNYTDFPADTRVAANPTDLITATSHVSGLGPPGVDDPGPYTFAAAGLFFAFGDAGGVSSSTDGVVWQVGALGSDDGLGADAFCHDPTTNTYVAIGAAKWSYTP